VRLRPSAVQGYWSSIAEGRLGVNVDARYEPAAQFNAIHNYKTTYGMRAGGLWRT
jgi:hypothetical protein